MTDHRHDFTRYDLTIRAWLCFCGARIHEDQIHAPPHWNVIEAEELGDDYSAGTSFSACWTPTPDPRPPVE